MPMNILYLFLALLWGYLLGSFNFAILISKAKFRTDVRKYGSGNAGATNVLRTFGKRTAAATFAGDAIKCIVAIVVVRVVFSGLTAPWGDMVQIAAGTGAFVGHCFPVYFGFKGGKGMAVGTTLLAMIDWRLFLGSLLIFILVAVFTRMISLSSVLGALAFFIASLVYRYEDGYFLIWGAFMFLFVLYNHRENMKRVLNGTESKIGSKAKEKQQ